MTKELRVPWPAPEARRPRRVPPALVIAPGIRVADWEKFSAKGGNRVPHRSPKASDRWHPQFDFEEDRNRNVVRFYGLVFNDNGTLRMDCAEINDGVPE